MTHEVKDLIAKINQEGVKAAEEKARQIEEEARQKAKEILARAEKEAQNILSAAKEEQAKLIEKGKVLLAQSGRDLLLSLKEEINSLLMRLIYAEAQQALAPEALQKIIMDLVKGALAQQKEEIVITLKKEDLEFLEKGFLSKLKEEAKKGIVLKPSQELRAGFTISFDAGRSCYDFSDKALAEYIGRYLKPKLAEIFK